MTTRRRRRLAPLMVQGTSSHAGKSFLTAALCRIFLRRGYEVAPFKAQNMSNNAAVANGGEIGRAQSLQAAAARRDPDVRMNPLLLKPTGDRSCQAVLMGTATGTFSVSQINRRKPVWFKTVRRAFRSLSLEHDLIVIEGAGSCAEINLRAVDYANMRVAAMARAPVIIVGDIDRGGVFASLYGTHSLLTPAERNRVMGFCINKFRGDPSLLDPGFNFIRQRTGKEILGVIPFDSEIHLPEEDSLALGLTSAASRLPPAGRRRGGSATIEIGLVRTPHIANFTDYDPFYVEPDVRVRHVATPRDLEGLDSLILPGSKNVFGDMRFLRRTKLDRAIRGRNGMMIVGVCGGYQLLGETVVDPDGVENGVPESMDGLGLLPVFTKFSREKIVKPVVRSHRASRSVIRGYEIHSGVLFPSQGRINPMFENDDGTAEGCVSKDGRVWATLTHGVFDSDSFRCFFLNQLRRLKGIPRKTPTPFEIEPMIERAADLVEAHLDIDVIERRLKRA